MNQKEKEQVVRMIKATAARRKSIEVSDVAKALANAQLSKLKRSSEFKKLVAEYRETERAIKLLDKQKDRAKKQAEKLAERFNCTIPTYGDIDVSENQYHYEQLLNHRIDDKTEEVILKVLTSGSTKEAMAFVMELKNMKLY